MKPLLFIFLCLLGFTAVAQGNKTLLDKHIEVGDSITVPELLFVLDGNGHENDSTLQQLADFIKAHKDMVFEIGCHTSSKGNSKSNYTLTQARAESIKQALVTKFAVDNNQIVARGYGATQPIVTDTTIRKEKSNQAKEALHSRNNRTQVKVLHKL